MNFVDKNIINTYTNLLESLSNENKKELITSLTKSLSAETTKKASKFFNAFGAFASTDSPEQIIKDLRKSRKFRKRELAL